MDLRSDKQCKNPYTKCFFIKHFFYSLPKLNGKRMRKRAIEQGILIFPAGAATDVQVAGRTLLQRGIRTMASAGIKRVLVVLPPGHAPSGKSSVPDLDIQVEQTTPEAACLPDAPLLLLRGDCVHHHSSLQALIDAGLQRDDLVAQTSDGVSSGAFLCAPGALPLDVLTGNLWAAFEERPHRREDVIPHLWQHVTDKHSACAAKNMLFEQVSKAASGTVARLLNVRISVPISKLIVDTGISPNMVTFFMVLCPGLFAAYLATQPDDYLRLAVAGVLWQLASILDGCDGEIARVKLAETKFGAWFDTVTDNLAYLFGYAALTAGMWHLDPDNYLPIYAGISAIASMVLTLVLLYSYALKTGTGSLQYYLGDLGNKVPDYEKDWSYRFLERAGFITKRDFLSLFIAVGLVANLLAVVYWLLIVLLHVAALGVLTTHYRRMGNQRAAEPQIAALPAPAVNPEEIA